MNPPTTDTQRLRELLAKAKLPWPTNADATDELERALRNEAPALLDEIDRLRNDCDSLRRENEELRSEIEQLKLR